MNFEHFADESLLAYYDSIQRQVAATTRLGGRSSLIGASAKRYAEELKREMDLRHLRFTPIEWP